MHDRSRKASRWLHAAAEAIRSTDEVLYTRQQLVRYLDQVIPLDLRRYRPAQAKLPELLEKEGVLHTVRLFPHDRKPRSKQRPVFNRFTTRPSIPLAVAQSLRSGSYLCHSTAAALHDLARPGSTIYVNKEQTPKPPAPSGLTQEGITRAFAGNPRHTTYRFTDGTNSYVLLNGKHTGDAGVERISHEQGPLRVTSLARTVLDLVVRPQYGGGAQGVLDAIRRAAGRVTVEQLAALLERLSYVYPYHQSLGYYLEKAGYPVGELRLLLERGITFDFYLEHGKGSTRLDGKWRVYYPPSLR
jgi:hypothetical protein